MPTWNRKTAADGSRKKRALEKVKAYLENQSDAEQSYSQTMQEYFNLNDLDVCFNNLHKNVDLSMIEQVQKFTRLEQGIFILLEGNVTYTWTKYRHDRGRRDHLFALAKSGNFSNLGQNSPERANLLKNGYSILINTPFAVLQSEGNNILTNQDCVFIKLTDEAVENTKFVELKDQRVNIFSKIKLPGPNNFSTQSLIHFNLNLHHTMKLRQMSFRNKFEVCQLGIVISGSASLKVNPQQKVQFSKSCIILPNFQYDVSTSQVQILQVFRNPTITFKNPQRISKFVEDLQKVQEREQKNEKKQIRKYRQKIALSVSVRKQKQDTVLISKQKRKKKKQFSIFSKQCQQFCIVPIEINKENLTQIKLRKSKDHQSSQNTQKPRILFSFQQKLNQRPLKRNSASSMADLNQSNTSVTGQKVKLMERYEVYAKDIFQQFMKQSVKSPFKQHKNQYQRLQD